MDFPIQTIKDDMIIISYFSSDTVFYTKRIKLARFNSCKVNFNLNGSDSIGVSFEPALNMFEELDVELKSKTDIHKRFVYDESIWNGISFKRNMIAYDQLHKTASVRLQKLYEEKYTEPMSIQIKASTMIERKIEDVPVIRVE